jgi:hypothetical protein
MLFIRRRIICKGYCIFEQILLMFILQDSVYYHPTLNPSGAPPPGKPPMYKSSIGSYIHLSFACKYVILLKSSSSHKLSLYSYS